MRRALQLLALVLGVIMGGCVTSAAMVRSAENYNLAVERTQTEMLLLNVLRAKDHSPLYLTDMSKLNGSVTRKVTGSSTESLTTAWNRGGSGPAHTLTRLFGVTPGFEMSENPSFQVDVLSTQEFMQGFLKPVSQTTFAYYLQIGWPADLLFHLLVKEVKLTCKEATGAPRGKTWYNHPSSAAEGPLGEFGDLVRTMVGAHELESKVEVLTDNSAADVGKTSEPVTLEELVAAGKEGFRVTQVGASWLLQRPSTKKQLKLNNWQYFEKFCKPDGIAEDKTVKFVLIQEALAGSLKGEATLTEKDQVTYVKDLSLEMRSPEGLLYYLGQLARLGESGGSVKIPRSCDGYAARPIFVFRRGECSPAVAACVNYQGETYVVPKRDDKTEGVVPCAEQGSFTPLENASGGESTHALSLLQQLIALQKSSKDFEGTPVVRVIGQ